MSIAIHQRPGVYSSYQASSLIQGGGGRKVVGLAAQNTQATANQLMFLTSYEDALAVFGQGRSPQHIAELVRIILFNGAAAVAAVPVADSDSYEDAFAVLDGRDGISFLLCDSTESSVQQALRDHAIASSAARRERIALFGGDAQESVQELIQRAKALNSERAILVAPGGEPSHSGVAAAAALAGALASQHDPALPLGGVPLSGLPPLSQTYRDEEIDLLIQGGVTPLETLAGTISVVRGVTTRTSTSGADDSTWRELSTILIVDDVIPSIRNSLRTKFPRAKNTPQGRAAIRTQVVLELEHKKDREIIAEYGQVTVTPHATEPTICQVSFSFTVVHGLNQIWLTAHITL